jgi:hypothetical protein
LLGGVPNKRIGAKHLSRGIPNKRIEAKHPSRAIPNKRIEAKHLSCDIPDKRIEAKHLSRSIPNKRIGAKHLSCGIPDKRIEAKQLLGTNINSPYPSKDVNRLRSAPFALVHHSFHVSLKPILSWQNGVIYRTSSTTAQKVVSY